MDGIDSAGSWMHRRVGSWLPDLRTAEIASDGPHDLPFRARAWRETHCARAATGTQHVVPDEPSLHWPEPIDCFSHINADPSDVTEDDVPPALWPFVCDTAARMGVTRSTVTLGCLGTCSAAISDEWRIQPKRYDDTRTENARVWGAIVGPPSVLKTPVIGGRRRGGTSCGIEP